MTLWDVCPSRLDRDVANLLLAQAEALAAFTPAQRNPAADTSATPEAEQARAELRRLASLRRRLGELFDSGVATTAPWSDADAAAAGVDWLRTLDPADDALMAQTALRLSDPLLELRNGGPILDGGVAASLVEIALADPAIELHALANAVGVDIIDALTRAGADALAARTIDPDAGVEVLAPLRIETRFSAPDADRANWLLRLRVYPDEVSIARPPAAPSAEELDRLDEALAAPYQDAPVDDAAAFTRLAATVGAPRAAWLLRTIPVSQPDPAQAPRADRALVAAPRDGFAQTQRPAGLPPAIDVWIVPPGGAPELVRTLTLDRDAIAGDLDLGLFEQVPDSPGELPVTWWTSFQRAVDVQLGAEIELGPDPPELEAIVVCGLGDGAADELFEGHAEAGRLAILPPGTATNTVEGETTTELGRDPDAWQPLASASGLDETATTEIMRVLTGRDDLAVPLLNGHTDVRGPAGALLEALWPALWGRALRDVAGAGIDQDVVGEWARRHLTPEGPYAAIRVGAQPYGLLPATSLAGWNAHEADPVDEDRLRTWVLGWRDAAVTFADPAIFGDEHGTVVGADGERLLALLGESAPSARWAARPVAPLRVARSLQAFYGLDPANQTPWDEATAKALAGSLAGFDPIAPAGRAIDLPIAELEDPNRLAEIIEAEPQVLLRMSDELGLFGHLLRGSMLIARALVGQAFTQADAGADVDPGAQLAISDSEEFVIRVKRSDRARMAQLEGASEAGRLVVARFGSLQQAAREALDRWVMDPERAAATLYPLLDCAAFRVDPWAIGIADRRLRRLAGKAPFRLGAFGWVDAPRPYDGAPGGPLAPGPTAAGMLHAPSPTQALTAALLRDAAVRYPGDDRWQLTIDSARVRDADRLAERVRLGVHPYEALGLEVERLVGEWETVRVLRRAFPLRGDGDERRCCDGRRVLAAVLRGEEALPAGLPFDIAERIEPLDHVLDTYADLLVADGVHALVSGRADLANAAMEAAAGLGAPPKLRAIRTPRESKGVTVTVLAALPAAADPPADAGPAVVADPHFAALLDAELGDPSAWRWTLDGAALTLADAGLHGAELLDLPSATLVGLLRGGAGGTLVSDGGSVRIERARRLATLLGGGEDGAPVAAAVTGDGGLRARLDDLVARADALAGDLPALDPAGALATLARWNIDPVAEDPEGGPAARVLAGIADLQARIAAAAAAPAADVAALRAAIRALCGHASTPVLPVGSLPGGLVDAPRLDRDWLEVVAAVRPRLAALEARQLTEARAWPGAVASPGGTGDPWAAEDPVTVVYGDGLAAGSGSPVAVAALDGWVDSIPSRRHTTSAAFGFNGPKSRAPQALLLGVPPDLSHRMTAEELRDVVLETRSLVRARAARPDPQWRRVATPAPLLPGWGEREDYEPLMRRWLLS
jgi:hypothetical protein